MTPLGARLPVLACGAAAGFGDRAVAFAFLTTTGEMTNKECGHD